MAFYDVVSNLWQALHQATANGNKRLRLRGPHAFTGKVYEDTLNLSAGFHGIDVPVSSKAAYSLLDCDADTGFLSLLTDGTAATRYPLPVTRHPLPVTRYTWSPFIFLAQLSAVNAVSLKPLKWSQLNDEYGIQHLILGDKLTT